MLDKVGQQNGHPQQTNKVDSLHTGPSYYYVIIGLGVGWVQKMAIFAYYQYIVGRLILRLRLDNTVPTSW